ncbi:MAG: NAD(P)-dependent oxidoreductase [Tepidisphaeraceae bacterium]|jgi:phosphoglycerate dehydrogenase-like enzyme
MPVIWSNAHLPADAAAELAAGVAPHRLLLSPTPSGSLATGQADPQLAEATIAFGQPDVRQVMELPNLKWIQLTTAGYARYDRPDVRQALQNRGASMTNASTVFAEPCAQHALAFMFAQSRQLPRAVANQLSARAWPQTEIRHASRLLRNQTVLMLGLGAIARRLIELLAPLKLNVIAVRRSPRGQEKIPVYPNSDLPRLLPQADHIVNILPSTPETDRLFNAEKFAILKPTAVFYNIGRGTTVDQTALAAALTANRLAAAYLDVTDPEPLPPEHPLWLAPNCHITPHTAGGHAEEFLDTVRHFLANLKRFESGQSLQDQIMP